MNEEPTLGQLWQKQAVEAAKYRLQQSDYLKTFYEMLNRMNREELEAFDNLLAILMYGKDTQGNLSFVRGWVSAILANNHGVNPWPELVDDQAVDDLLSSLEDLGDLP